MWLFSEKQKLAVNLDNCSGMEIERKSNSCLCIFADDLNTWLDCKTESLAEAMLLDIINAIGSQETYDFDAHLHIKENEEHETSNRDNN